MAQGRPPIKKAPKVVYTQVVAAIEGARRRGLQRDELAHPVSRSDEYPYNSRVWVWRALNQIDTSGAPAYMTLDHANCLVWRANEILRRRDPVMIPSADGLKRVKTGLRNAPALFALIGRHEETPRPARMAVFPGAQEAIAEEVVNLIAGILPRGAIGRDGERRKDVLRALSVYFARDVVDSGALWQLHKRA